MKNFFCLCGTFCVSVALMLFFAPHLAHALELTYPHALPGFTGDPNAILGGGNVNLGNLFQFLFAVALWSIGLLTFASLLFLGFMYETSGANPMKRSGAKRRFQQTLIGVLLLLGFTIVLRTINPEFPNIQSEVFNLCGTAGCPKIQAPVVTNELHYEITSYKDPTVSLGTTPSLEEQRFDTSFQTWGLIPFSQMADYDPKGNPPHNSLDFFTNNVRYVIDTARSKNVNPIFAVAVWRVGTLESDGSNPFGCITASNANVSQTLSFTDSFRCFLGSVNDSTNFVQWLSNYCDPTQTDALLCNERQNFMALLHSYYDDNIATGGSAFGLLAANEPGASQATPGGQPITTPQW